MRKCRHCKEPYEPKLPMQRACSVKCAAELAKQLVEKKQRKVWREKKARLKTRQQWIKECQHAFNAFIRHRDLSAGLPCVSCQRHHDGQWHAGHYRSTKAASGLRFGNPADPHQQLLAEANCWLQCKPCNADLSGNAISYRLNLLRRVGPETIEAIEAYNEPKRWTVEELKAIKDHYKTKLREAQRNGAVGDGQGTHCEDHAAEEALQRSVPGIER